MFRRRKRIHPKRRKTSQMSCYRSGPLPSVDHVLPFHFAILFTVTDPAIVKRPAT
jgi:hypothetical protein